MLGSVDDFLRRLAEIDLMPQDGIQSVLDSLPDLDRSQDAQPLAQELVRQKKLSRFQAQAIYQGRTRGLVLGNYVLLDKIGEGGMGQVYKAEHRRMRRVVAIKVLPPHIVKSPETLQRFQREVEAAARLEHPNIVTAHDADEFQGVHYLVMQYVEGSDLANFVRKHGPFPLVKAIELAIQIGRGLQHAHHRGIVHRDIKPANLLLDVHGTVKILDMGLARYEQPLGPSVITAPEGVDATELTASGSVVGTVDYMSPEQAMDAKTSDHRSDIYSLGCTWHFLLTGRPVYAGDNFIQKLVAHREAPLPSLDDVPPELNVVFRKMIAKKPADRYQQTDEFVRELHRLLPIAHAWVKTRPATRASVGPQPPPDAPPAPPSGMEETIVWEGLPEVEKGDRSVGPEGTPQSVAQPASVISSAARDDSRLRQLLGDDFSLAAERISLCQKNISDVDLAELTQMANLQALDLEGTPISDEGLAHLRGLTNLRRLDLSGTAITAAGLGQLESLGELRRLFLAETAVSDAGMPSLAKFLHLDRLSLRLTAVGDAGLIHLAGLRQLRSLDLSGTRITDRGLTHLKQMSALEEIDLSGTRVSTAGVRALIRLLPKTEIML